MSFLSIYEKISKGKIICPSNTMIVTKRNPWRQNVGHSRRVEVAIVIFLTSSSTFGLSGQDYS